ncbi:MAG: PQQ-binding-like beta-propeller repeat protein [Rhodospirillales bacterium]|nr:PQQ-binding-like beta-propeller repeat protein [Rhodospirillales bacterium]
MMNDKYRLSRRVAVLAPLGLLSGCGVWDSWFGSTKAKLPGTRVAVMDTARRLTPDITNATVALPRPAANADWPQAGGVASHDMEHPALAPSIAPAWSADIGAGGGYRRKITAQPVVAGGRIFTMDSDAVIDAFDTARGERQWRFNTRGKNDGSANVGGGIAVDGTMLYAATGRGDVLAVQAATGKLAWRVNIGTAARSAPTIAEGKLFVPTIDYQLQALSAADGHKMWSYQASAAETLVLGVPAPAYAGGLVVAGFGSGDLVCLRASAGGVAWLDSLAAPRGRNSLVDLSSIRGRPVIRDGIVYTIGLGGLMVASDLRSGRRVWEREIASTETPWVAGDWVFVLSDDRQLAAIRRADGLVGWATQLDMFRNMKAQTGPIHWVGPVLAGDRLVVAGSNGRAVSVSPYTGKILGQIDLGGTPSMAPIVAGGTLYILTNDATLSALR